MIVLLAVLLSLLGLAGVVSGACFLVNGASAVARRAHISEFVIGMVIVGFGTSMPELLVSLFGAVNGSGDVAIGNVVGSNIFNVLLILGLAMLIRPEKMPRSGLMADMLICLAASVVLYLMGFGFTVQRGGVISRLDGGILLVLFVLFFWRSLKVGRANAVETDSMQASQPLWRSIVALVGGLVLLVGGAKLFVNNAVEIAHLLNVSDSFIAVTLLAGGTSLPELAVSVTAALKRHSDMSLGNIVGSNIFNILFILGACSVITPLQAEGVGPFDMFVMIYAVLLLMVWAVAYRRRPIPRWQALLMLLSYAAYIYVISR